MAVKSLLFALLIVLALIQGATSNLLEENTIETTGRELSSLPAGCPRGHGIEYYSESPWQCKKEIDYHQCEQRDYVPVHFGGCGCACLKPWLAGPHPRKPTCPKEGDEAWYKPYHFKVCKNMPFNCKAPRIKFRNWECGCGCMDPPAPTPYPTPSPTAKPTPKPTPKPKPTPDPYGYSYPTVSPTLSPSITASNYPTGISSYAPSVTASYAPTVTASYAPSFTASYAPSFTASYAPSVTASNAPSVTASNAPSVTASNAPTVVASENPSEYTCDICENGGEFQDPHKEVFYSYSCMDAQKVGRKYEGILCKEFQDFFQLLCPCIAY